MNYRYFVSIFLLNYTVWWRSPQRRILIHETKLNISSDENPFFFLLEISFWRAQWGVGGVFLPRSNGCTFTEWPRPWEFAISGHPHSLPPLPSPPPSLPLLSHLPHQMPVAPSIRAIRTFSIAKLWRVTCFWLTGDFVRRKGNKLELSMSATWNHLFPIIVDFDLKGCLSRYQNYII